MCELAARFRPGDQPATRLNCREVGGGSLGNRRWRAQRTKDQIKLQQPVLPSLPACPPACQPAFKGRKRELHTSPSLGTEPAGLQARKPGVGCCPSTYLKLSSTLVSVTISYANQIRSSTSSTTPILMRLNAPPPQPSLRLAAFCASVHPRAPDRPPTPAQGTRGGDGWEGGRGWYAQAVCHVKGGCPCCPV